MVGRKVEWRRRGCNNVTLMDRIWQREDRRNGSWSGPVTVTAGRIVESGLG